MAQDLNKRNSYISSFKKNIIFVLKLFLGIALLAGYISYIMPQYSRGYEAALIDKVDRLESIHEPKIVLLGHSNLAFGIDSKLIEDAMGMPVVNMGLHGGNGNAFHEEMAKFNVVPGDIYVICHSNYEDNDKIENAMTSWAALEDNYHLWKLIRPRDITTMVRYFPVYLKGCLDTYSAGNGNKETGTIYSRSAFNEYGDIKETREENEVSFDDGVVVPNVNSTCANRINELDKYLRDRGATLLIAGYPIGNGQRTPDVNEYIDFQRKLVEKMDCPVISNYADYMLDYSYFYNTELHLTNSGTEVRTKQLIADLKRWQETNSEASMESEQYIDIVADINLSHVNDITSYLDALVGAKDRYTIIFSGKGDMSVSSDDAVYDKFLKLGIGAEIKDKRNYSFASIIDNGIVRFEKSEHEKIVCSGNFDDGNIEYSIVSGGLDRGDCSSIQLNGHEYSKNGVGLNIVVYSNETHRVLDSVAFDIDSAEVVAIR